jgi:hypothetical protein
MATAAKKEKPRKAVQGADRKKIQVSERLRHPHIMAEMLRISVSQSAGAQRDFLKILEGLACGIREMLDAEGWIYSVPIDHAKTWKDFAGKPICFVDGGVASAQGLGAEPIGVRVGSYTVIPGDTSEKRETFRMEKQLVAELFDSSSPDGVYEDLYEDTSKLRDAIRISLELAAGVSSLKQDPKPQFLFLHGALVNPVSAYGDESFPAFSKKGLELLLPDDDKRREGRDAKFVTVCLELLNQLKHSKANIASVVERASGSQLVSMTLLDELQRTDSSPGPQAIKETKNRIRDFRISDSVLFHAILCEGEYLKPTEVDRNVDSKRPNYSRHIIAKYPYPKVTYVGVGEFSQPIRVEFFDGPEPPAGYAECIRLLIHSSRLMPNYAFPAGLDIVDKFAKVPAWMNRPIHSSMSVQLIQQALATGNTTTIDAAKRMVCGTRRDWLFRPTHNG